MTASWRTDTKARAYHNHSRWVADCPRAHCANAEALAPAQGTFHCSACHHVAPLDWPADAEQITVTLARRPVPSTRNWFPSGHELALRAGLPHGQSVADLEAETREHMED
jgi:hypothetical protein